jgi:ubiquinone/menaquinone biosynthesis C-methylase UbiE
MRRARLEELYDSRAPGYDRIVGRAERIALGRLRSEFGAALTGATLEIAIGTGMNLPHYTDGVTRAVGVDLSAGMLAVARAKADSLGLPIALIQADAASLPFRDQSFDTVAVSLSLCTIPDPVAALREMSRVCQPEGRIVMMEHILSPHRPVAAVERAIAPFQRRALGCHLDRQTIETARGTGMTILSERTRLLGVIRLAIARPAAI